VRNFGPTIPLVPACVMLDSMTSDVRPAVQGTRNDPTERSTARWQWLAAAGYAGILVWINVYLIRDLFRVQTAPMNSMHGFWMAIARWSDGGWLHSQWWPYWDCGIPFEFTYAPLVPALTAVISAASHVSLGLAFQSVSVLAYALAPLTLFLMAWRMTGSPHYSFLAALFYSLAAPTRVLVPDESFVWRNFWDARRMFLMVDWDDTPHVLGLSFLPLAILFLWLSMHKRRPIYYAAAVVSIAAAALSTTFGPVMVAIAAICLLSVAGRRDWTRNLLLVAAIGGYAYALSSRFLPATLLHAIGTATGRGRPEESLGMGTVTALAIVVLGWLVIWRYLPRWTSDRRLQFFTLFAYLTACPPVLAF